MDVASVRDFYELGSEVATAAYGRDATIQAIRDRYGMDALNDQSDDLGDRLAEGAEAIMATPAPDLAALRWKLDYLSGDGHAFAAWEEDYTRQAFADMARLLPEGR